MSSYSDRNEKKNKTNGYEQLEDTTVKIIYRKLNMLKDSP